MCDEGDEGVCVFVIRVCVCVCVIRVCVCVYDEGVCLCVGLGNS